jgi:hypothetical protein
MQTFIVYFTCRKTKAAVGDGGLGVIPSYGVSAKTQRDPPAGIEASRGSPENSE